MRSLHRALFGPLASARLALLAVCTLGPQLAAARTPAFASPAASSLQVPEGAGRRSESAPFDLPADDANAIFDRATQGIMEWFTQLGEPLPREAFGAFVVRAGRLMLGRPYGFSVEVPGQEVVDFDVAKFQCESFVEATLAVARCGWMQEATPACFRREVARMRYRHGAIKGYGSRLHYFEDWLDDNALRGTVSLWSAKLGGKKLHRSTAYMTDHLGAYPALQDGNELRRVVAAQRRLSQRPVDVIFRQDVAAAERHLQDGDIVAIVTRRPDILVHHAGLVDQDDDHSIHLLHASSARHQVVRTAEGISAYLARKPERQGILVARPLAPPRPSAKERAQKAANLRAGNRKGHRGGEHAPLEPLPR